MSTTLALPASAYTAHDIGKKAFEFTNHLGNVLSTISDKPMPHVTGSTVDYFLADIRTASDYSPFGVVLRERDFILAGAESFRYTFQNQEHDDELKGSGNSLNFEFRMYDPRIGRFFAIDPLTAKYPHNSPYAFSENNVIHCVELEGLEKISAQVLQIASAQLDKGNFGDLVESDIVTKNCYSQIQKNLKNNGSPGLVAKPMVSHLKGHHDGFSLQSGTPSQLLDDMVANPDKYVFDCAGFVQVAILYGFKQTLGNTEFDSHFSKTMVKVGDSEIERYDFFLQQHASAGLETTFYKSYNDSKSSQNSAMKKIKKLQPGARISLVSTNPSAVAAEDANFATENLVYLGNGKYSGMGVGVNVTLQEAMSELKKITGTTYRIDEIEKYKLGDVETTQKNKALHKQ